MVRKSTASDSCRNVRCHSNFIVNWRKITKSYTVYFHCLYSIILQKKKKTVPMMFPKQTSLNAHEVETNRTEHCTQATAQHEGSCSLFLACVVTFECSHGEGDQNIREISKKRALLECFIAVRTWVKNEWLCERLSRSCARKKQNVKVMFTSWKQC